MRFPALSKSIADQVIRSASSVPADFAEGQGRAGRDRLNSSRIQNSNSLHGISVAHLPPNPNEVDAHS